MRFEINTIKHKNQKYPTVGDYWTDKFGVRQIRVSKMDNEDYHFLVILHEMIEQHLALKRGIKEEDITAFDILYEAERDMGRHKQDEEPGDDKRAPYYKEHQFATKIEMLVASEAKVNWKKYDKTVASL